MVRLRSPAPISQHLGDFPSGQRGQTVNLLSSTSVVRIHHPPPTEKGHQPVSFFCCLGMGLRTPFLSKGQKCGSQDATKGVWELAHKCLGAARSLRERIHPSPHFICYFCANLTSLFFGMSRTPSPTTQAWFALLSISRCFFILTIFYFIYICRGVI